MILEDLIPPGSLFYLYILTVLKKCDGRVAGANGAAELLDVPPTTLYSKMKRLGITRKHVSENEN